MLITVKYFASLREKMGKDTEQLEFSDQVTVKQIWEQVSPAEVITDNPLCAVNMEYADWEVVINAGDEVAFFPKVTGGSI